MLIIAKTWQMNIPSHISPHHSFNSPNLPVLLPITSHGFLGPTVQLTVLPCQVWINITPYHMAIQLSIPNGSSCTLFTNLYHGTAWPCFPEWLCRYQSPLLKHAGYPASYVPPFVCHESEFRHSLLMLAFDSMSTINHKNKLRSSFLSCPS